MISFFFRKIVIELLNNLNMVKREILAEREKRYLLNNNITYVTT